MWREGIVHLVNRALGYFAQARSNENAHSLVDLIDISRHTPAYSPGEAEAASLWPPKTSGIVYSRAA
jgi:hypothetical protein